VNKCNRQTPLGVCLFGLSKSLFLTDWQRSRKSARQVTRPRRRTDGTVEGALRSKSKYLAQQAFHPSSVKNQRFLPPSPEGKALDAPQNDFLVF